MGFLDKAMSKVQETTKAAQEKLDDVSAKRKADALLRDLGAWTYASHKGGFPDAQANIDRVIAELTAHEAEHGPLGAAADAPAAPAPTEAPPPPAAAPPPPPPPATEPPPSPPPGGAGGPPEAL